MKVALEVQNASGTFTKTSTETVSLPCFLKSFAMSGQGFMPTYRKFLRSIGFFLMFSDYFHLSAFQGRRFSKPPARRYDVTERNQFSNMAGKAFADLFARRESGAIVSFNYEAAMKFRGLKIRGPRPDLLCSTGSRTFAVEAKGFTRTYVSPQHMQKYKKQSGAGPLAVQFSVASVSHGLYERVKVKYHDPVASDVPYDEQLISGLAQQYYKGLVEYLLSEDFAHESFFVGNREVVRLSLSDGSDPAHALYRCWLQRMGFRNVSLLLDAKIKYAAETGSIMEFGEVIEDEGVFVDSDGIGIAVSVAKESKDNGVVEC